MSLGHQSRKGGLRPVEIHQIRGFLAVAEELHFGRAAQKLHIAQPALSRTIQQLERELKTPLFHRSTRSVQLTASGRAFVEPAAAVIEALRRAELAVRGEDGSVYGDVRVAFAGLSTHALVAQLARVVREEFPGVHLDLSSQNHAQQGMKKLMGGDADIALGRWDAIPGPIRATAVVEDSLVLAVSERHPLADRASAKVAEVASTGFVVLSPSDDGVLHDRLRRLAQAEGFVPDVVQEAPDTATALAIVAAEVGCHLTFASVAGAGTRLGVRFVAVDTSSLDGGDIDVPLRVAWRRGDNDAATRAVLQALLTVSGRTP
mgnify:CR=1 FL=1